MLDKSVVGDVLVLDNGGEYLLMCFVYIIYLIILKVKLGEKLLVCLEKFSFIVIENGGVLKI